MAKIIVYIIDGCISALMIIMLALVINQYIVHEPDRLSLLYIGKLYNNWYSPPMVSTADPGVSGYTYFHFASYPGLNTGCKCDINGKLKYFEGICSEEQILEKCQTVNEENPRVFSIWNTTYSQVKSKGLDYLSYLVNSPNNTDNTNGCGNGMKQCGILDTHGNILCLDQNEECPGNLIKFEDYKGKMFNNYTDQPIIVQLNASSGEPCIHPNRINYQGKILDIRKDKDLLGCPTVLNNKTTDSRFKVFGTIPLLKFYQENMCFELSTYEESENEGKNNVSLYIINYIGLDRVCFGEHMSEIQSNDFKKIKILTMISDYQSSKMAYILFAVFVCFSMFLLILHWIINLQKNYRLMAKLESQIWSLICLLSFFSSFVYMKFLFNSSFLFKIHFGCGDDITNAILEDAENFLFTWKIKGLFMFLFGLFIGILVFVRDILTKDEVLKADYIQFVKPKEDEEEENEDVDESFSENRNSKISVEDDNING